MLYILKPFPEIYVKSRSVRSQMSQQIQSNLARIFQRKKIKAECLLLWGFIRVSCDDESNQTELETIFANTPGIDNAHRVKKLSFTDIHSIYQHVADIWGEKLENRSFSVRCKCVNHPELSGSEIARYVGGGLNQNHPTGGVNLSNPDDTILLEIRNHKLYVTEDKITGMGGFPLGSQGATLSLISGGFDSAVSSYLTMARGIKTHFLFFNMGGSEHELQVKEIAYYLWQRFGSSHKIKFISVPFEPVVHEILSSISDTQMGVVLKRLFVRSACDVAQHHKLDSIVTGEAIAQVASQTLVNLALIDEVASKLVIRPLITSHKKDIIDIARNIGTESFSANIPEYCGVISKKPTTHARAHKISQEESNFDFSVLDEAVKNAQVYSIEKMGALRYMTSNIQILNTLDNADTIIDIRHPMDQEKSPLTVNNPVIDIPFYQLQSKTSTLDNNKVYYLYCDQGVMSQLHAEHLHASGQTNVHVFRPE